MSDMHPPVHSFRLTRAFSIVSMIGILLVAFVMAYFYRVVAVDALMSVQNESNADLTRAFSDTIWNRYSDAFSRLSALPADQLAKQPEIAALDKEIKHRVRGMRVVKIKIYDRNGLTVFSTEKKQIGENKHDNPGFLGAMRGEVVSEIVFKDKFNAFDKTIENRNLLSSYIPVRSEPDEPPRGVFELYSDITTLLKEVRQTEYKIMALVVSLMLALYAYLLIYVRRADGIIKRREEEERAIQQERIRYLAQYDQLTGLPNRVQVLKLLEQAVQRVQAADHSLAIVYLDIDHFKLINDNLGHEAGDKVLLEIVARIQRVAFEQKIIARMGGDEIVLVLENVIVAALEGLATRLIGRLSRPLYVTGKKVTLTVAMGITLFPDDNSSAEQLLKNAEAAMLRAKKLGRNRLAFFTEELNAQAVERFKLEHGLHKAQDNQEFELYYQPRVDGKTGKILGAEALLRWRRNDGSIISPVLFVPILEEMGLIVSVGKWVLQSACQQCKLWHEQGHPELHISVNLSMRQFHSESFLEDIRGALLETGLEADYLELELTESLLAEDVVNTTRLLNDLKAIGVRLSIDDFGTGYSSLSYLMHFPVDCLKIDRAFVKDAVTNEDHANLTRTIVAMAKNLKLKTVAEGVETEAHREFLSGLSCDEMQGYLFYRPLPAAEFLECLDK
jgi:diguanylate cyclase (GGDEF)-like protein